MASNPSLSLREPVGMRTYKSDVDKPVNEFKKSDPETKY